MQQKRTYSYKVTVISDNAFKNCKKLTNVKIGDNVITIGKNAFAGCVKLKKVTLSKAVTTIKESAFSGDKKLVEVVIPKDSQLETIGKNAFKGCVYIQDPYYRTDSKSMLVSAIHPMRYDSIGFPSVMSSVAKKLNSAATVEWSSSAHYLVNVTYNGETKKFGGAGSGGGQGIYENQIKYWYLFDGSKDDAFNKKTVKEVAEMICEYGKMTVPEEETDLPKLTWASVRKTVGKNGAYVKLVLINSIFGGGGTGYSFMYDNGSTSEGSQGWGSVGHFSNAWYDGRYFNNHEYYYPGAKFEDTVEKVQPAIVMKDVTLKLPDDGKTYMYSYKTMDKVENYNQETGLWSGFMTYRYDKETNSWKAEILNNIQYKENYDYKKIEDQDFIDACTITMDEAKTMEIDKNTDEEPDNYYIYDMVTEPGTYHSAGSN